MGFLLPRQNLRRELLLAAVDFSAEHPLTTAQEWEQWVLSADECADGIGNAEPKAPLAPVEPVPRPRAASRRCEGGLLRPRAVQPPEPPAPELPEKAPAADPEPVPAPAVSPSPAAPLTPKEGCQAESGGAPDEEEDAEAAILAETTRAMVKASRTDVPAPVALYVPDAGTQRASVLLALRRVLREGGRGAPSELKAATGIGTSVDGVLNKLAKEGLIAAEGQPHRRTYTLTAAGHEAAARLTGHRGGQSDRA